MASFATKRELEKQRQAAISEALKDLDTSSSRRVVFKSDSEDEDTKHVSFFSSFLNSDFVLQKISVFSRYLCAFLRLVLKSPTFLCGEKISVVLKKGCCDWATVEQ